MKAYMGKDYLLDSDYAAKLYYDFAEKMPIIDYHSHLEPQEIYHNKQYNNLSQIWLGGDHYKWRLMRIGGVEEKYITGDADDYSKFCKYIQALQYAMDSPLYHWSALELKRCFGINEEIIEQNTAIIWEKANDYIARNVFSPQKILTQFNVEALCTTDEGFSSLDIHKKIKAEGSCASKVLPTFRPDKLLQIDKDWFLDSIAKLGSVTNINISSYSNFLQALEMQLASFDKVGCKIADISFETLKASTLTGNEAKVAFDKKLEGKGLDDREVDAFIWHTLIFLMSAFARLGWAVQLHLGATRNNNAQMYKALGADAGYDSISEYPFVNAVSRLFDTLNNQDLLSKVIVYTLNPIYYYPLATMLGSFASAKSKLHLGAAWWFNDNIAGIKEQMSTLSALSLFSHSLGMLTDSRSFLSFTRHEFYRRLLCSFVGDKVEKGEFSADMGLLESIVKGICYFNIKEFLNL